jgi:hypothetical protein
MYLGTSSSLSNLWRIYFSSWIKTSKLCCCIRPTNFNITFCQGSNSWLLHLNSTYEFAFSIWLSSLLKFHYRLLVYLYASLLCTSQGIIDAAWITLWPEGFSSVHGCFYSDWKTLLGVTNYWFIWFTLKLLLMAVPFSTCSYIIT